MTQGPKNATTSNTLFSTRQARIAQPHAVCVDTEAASFPRLCGCSAAPGATPGVVTVQLFC
jgi:hypothetical protein